MCWLVFLCVLIGSTCIYDYSSNKKKQKESGIEDEVERKKNSGMN